MDMPSQEGGLHDMGTPEALLFGFYEDRLLVRTLEKGLEIPRLGELPGPDLQTTWLHPFGPVGDIPCYAAELPAPPESGTGLSLKGVRGLFGRMEEGLVWKAGLAMHLVHWHRTHRFCGRCGQPLKDHDRERAKVCPACGLMNHPRVTPAIIVSVVRGGEILLAHAARFPGTFFSVLAGFVEPGETLEACVAREVEEEVGIRVKDIRYFGSQPWPFPDSLMVGFTAAYAEGEIRVDASEITEAGWFSPEDLPDIPPKISIARRLIDHFIAVCGTEKGGGICSAKPHAPN